MKLPALLSALLLAPLSTLAQQAPPIPWAYQSAAPGVPSLPPKGDDGSQRRVAGSDVSMTLSATRDRFNAPDWHPAGHPAMPEVVLHGRKPNTFACAFCHRAEGQGGAENANISGLDKNYIIRQLQEIRSAARRSDHDRRIPMVLKHQMASTLTDEEISEGADYFSRLPARAFLKVVETDTVPKTGLYAGVYLLPLPGGETEALGQRIIEMPDDPDRFESRDTRTTFTAFVPRGSLERGKALAEASCVSCHGAGLKGGSGPRLAGQYATYLVRQLHDFQTGARRGVEAEQMATSVEKLPLADMIALAAYAASLTP